MRSSQIFWTVLILAMVALVTAPLISCTPTPDSPPKLLEGGEGNSKLWSRLLDQEPYPYTTPLPPDKATDIDGLYSKYDPREGTRPFCKRCMPYPAEGGTWLLQLDRGAYRILSARSLNGWRSMGSFTVQGDEIVLLNDPHCLEAVGLYAWILIGDELQLALIEDECADGWRGITFTNYPWTRDVSIEE
ncbi:hypothetical protein ACFLWA_07015 [Chloroflexota bacterium]